MTRFLLIITIAIFKTTLLSAQPSDLADIFSSLKIQTDSGSFSYPSDTIHKNGIPHLYFKYKKEKETVLIHLKQKENINIKSIYLLPSQDFKIIDSIIQPAPDHHELKIQFNELTDSEFLHLTFAIKTNKDTGSSIYQLSLLPFTRTILQFKPLSDQLYIGEEKVFELITNRKENIIYPKTWKKSGTIDYRVSETFQQLRLHLIPNETGENKLQLELKTKKPMLKDGKISHQLPPISHHFNVKKGRLQFLNISPGSVTLTEKNRLEGIEIQIDNSRKLKLNKTYRIENQEEPGGPLIGEIYTRSYLASNKVLCWLRVFNYHKKSEGYLYIKDGDTPQFITNFNITPKTTINNIQVLRPGKDWQSSTKVHPGETIFVRLNGEGLLKGQFRFEELNQLSPDSLVKTDERIESKFHIPEDISKTKIRLFNHNELTNHSLKVEEYEKPRDFDFAYVDYGPRKKLSGIRAPITYYPTIKDVAFNFKRFLIDHHQLHGKQYLNFKVRITDKDGKLLEMKTIDKIVVCPSEKSPRYEYYDKENCFNDDLRLNDYLRTKTYDLPEWSRISIQASHIEDKYNKGTKSKEIEIIQGKKYKFDVEVSFPAGLITVYKQEKTNDEGETYEEVDFGNLGGISMAMIAQFSFYHPDKIAKFRPYRFGAGFIALNTFNFTDNANQDLGAVILGSVYPTTKDTKLSFPLFLGGGYLLKAGQPFFLIGPGIRVKL